MQEPAEPFFLFLGATDSDAATSRLKADGAIYVKKMLESGTENWQKIIDLLRDPTLRGVLATLTGTNYRQLLVPAYESAGREILDAMAAVPHVVFVHETVFFSEEELPATEEPRDQEHDPHSPYMDPLQYFGEIEEGTRRQVNIMLTERDINVMPYKRNVERSILAAAFLDDSDKHLLFRIYVPSGRLYAAEADTLLGLFRNWLTQTGRNAIRQDGYRTSAGQVYEFFGSQAQTTGGLTQQFQDFTDFLDACVERPEWAAAQLEASGVEARVAAPMVSRYGKATRRLHLDLRHTREERLMALKHELESELLDCNDNANIDILPIVAALLPPVIRGAVGILTPAADTRAAAAGIHVTVNQQLIGQVAGSVIQSVQGTVNMGPEAKDLLGLISQYGEARAAELESAVHELEDPDARSQDRLAARQKLRRFLSSVGAQVTTMTLATLHKYLEQRIGVG